jgi:hypothetical protein
MIDKTLTTLAMLKTMYHKKMHVIDCYIPLIKDILLNHKISKIDADGCAVIERAFLDDCGLNVPLSGIVTMLKRLGSEFVTKRKNEYVINLKALSASSNISTKGNPSVVQEMIDGFRNFAQIYYNVDVSTSDIDCVFVDFFKAYHSEMVLYLHDNGAFPEIKPKSQHKRKLYILGEYLHSNLSKPELIDLLTDISIGMAISESVFLQSYTDYCCSFKDVNVYIDVHFLFYFVGIGGDYLQKSYKRYIENILQAGCKVLVFEQHLEEFNRALDDCCDWIHDPSYDEQKASKTCQFFMQNNLDESDAELFRARLSDLFTNPYNVLSVNPKIDYSKVASLIDEQDLKDTIISNYANWHKRVTYKIYNIIQRDVQAISTIYFLREGRYVESLKRASHVFVTSNTSLAFSAYKYHTKREKTLGKIPGCISSHFLNNLLWLGNPSQMAEKSIKLQLMSNISLNSELHPQILAGFIQELKKLKDSGQVSLDTVESFRHNMVLNQILKDITHNDPNNFDGQTSIDAMNEYEIQIKEPLEQEIRTKETEIKSLAEKNKSLMESIDSKDDEIEVARKMNNQFLQNLVQLAAHDSRKDAQFVFWSLTLVLIALTILSLFHFNIILLIFLSLASLSSLVYGLSLKAVVPILHNRLFHRKLRKNCRDHQLSYIDIINSFNGTAREYSLEYTNRSCPTLPMKRGEGSVSSDDSGGVQT